MACQLLGAGSLSLHQNLWLGVPRLLAGMREWWIESCLEPLPSMSQLDILQPPEWECPGWKLGLMSPRVHRARTVDGCRTNEKVLEHSPGDDALTPQTAPGAPGHLCRGKSLLMQMRPTLSSVWLLSPSGRMEGDQHAQLTSLASLSGSWAAPWDTSLV